MEKPQKEFSEESTYFFLEKCLNKYLRKYIKSNLKKSLEKFWDEMISKWGSESLRIKLSWNCRFRKTFEEILVEFLEKIKEEFLGEIPKKIFCNNHWWCSWRNSFKNVWKEGFFWRNFQINPFISSKMKLLIHFLRISEEHPGIIPGIMEKLQQKKNMYVYKYIRVNLTRRNSRRSIQIHDCWNNSRKSVYLWKFRKKYKSR